MTWVKICGVTRVTDAILAANLGADAVGLVFADSPRRVRKRQARAICKALPLDVLKVGVFRDAGMVEISEVLRACDLDMLQFHGRERAEFCETFGLPYLKSVDLDRADEGGGHPGCFALLADAPGHRGGTGVACDWNLAAGLASRRRLVLAGGLHPGNVSAALRRVRPFGVDVASGVEQAPGLKDPALLSNFIREAKK